MILQIVKYDLINLILGEYFRDKIDINIMCKIKEKYYKVLNPIQFRDKDVLFLFNENELEKLSDKELLDIYNNFLGGSIIEII